MWQNENELIQLLVTEGRWIVVCWCDNEESCESQKYAYVLYM